MNPLVKNKKILFKQKEIESILLESRQVMDITAHFLCSLLKCQFNHDQQNLLYSLSLSYNQMEQLINNTLKTNLGIDVFEQNHSTAYSSISKELTIKFEQLAEILHQEIHKKQQENTEK
ncbi:hypothetical protein [Aliikangiella sp. IMCC44359]|uniref:hypothetical protein n=1 Tax=Aliikangiella sp. IMCC44359 TaxID=3459125 RepID=UPI00403AACFA